MKIRVVEILRGVAALSVAMAHDDSLFGSNPDLPFGRWHSFALPGTAGVEFFFVLSGFVMAVAHGSDIATGGNIGAFLWKRFCRIYPLYWVVLAIPLHRYWGAPTFTPGAILAWMSLLPIRRDDLLVVAWTLRQEVTFYLMLALCLVPRIGRWAVMAWVAATALLWSRFGVPSVEGTLGQVVSQVFSIFNFEFFAGLLAGWLWSRVRPTRLRGAALLGAGVIVLAWRMSLDGWGVEYGPVSARPIYGAGYAAVLLGCAMLERCAVFRFGPRGARVAWVAGALSYPLYLSHLLTLDAVARWIGPSGVAAAIGPDLTFAVMLASALLVAALLAFLVDQPLQRLLRRVSVGSRSPRPVPG